MAVKKERLEPEILTERELLERLRAMKQGTEIIYNNLVSKDNYSERAQPLCVQFELFKRIYEQLQQMRPESGAQLEKKKRIRPS